MNYSFSPTVINPYVKLSVLLVLIYTTKTNFWISEFFNNLGIPYLAYQKIWFFYLPGLYILSYAGVNRRLHFEKVILVLFFFIVHYFFEKYIHGLSDENEDKYDLLHRWYYIYLLFIFLSNAGVKYKIYILNTTISLLFINSSLIYLDYLGLINVSEIASGTGNLEGRLTSVHNLNVVNDMGVFAIFCSYWLSILKTPYSLFKKEIPIYFFILFFSPLVFLQASRGSVLLLLAGLIIWAYYKWKKFSLQKKFLIPIIFIPLLILQSNSFEAALNEVSVFNRLKTTSLSTERSQEGRLLQIIATLENFRTSPLIGIGYERAAQRVFDGIERSNFHYTQILASGGIILFILYFLVVFNLFAASIELLKKDIIVLSVFTFVLVEFIFRRPEPYFAIMGYIVYVRNKYNLA